MEGLKTWEIREIMDLLKDDLFITESESQEEEIQELQEENENLKTELETEKEETKSYIDEVEEYSVDFEQLLEYLNDNGVLTDDLKNILEYYKKFIN